MYGQGREFEPRSDQFLALVMIYSVFNVNTDRWNPQ